MNFDFARRYLQAAIIQRDLAKALQKHNPRVAANCRHQMRCQAKRMIDHLRPSGRHHAEGTAEPGEVLTRAASIRLSNIPPALLQLAARQVARDVVASTLLIRRVV